MTVVSAAVIAYLGHGTRSWPGADRDAAAAVLVAGGLPPSQVEFVASLVAEALAVRVDWQTTPYAHVDRHVGGVMQGRHGGLTLDAALALGWNFSYQWR
jgi:hypothetical protein